MRPALRSELQKLRRLRTPRIVAAAIILIAVGGAAIAGQVGSASDPGDALANGTLGLDIASLFPPAYFAVWMFGLESGEGLLARTFTAEARRLRVVLAKLVLALALPAVALALAAALSAPLVSMAVTDAGGSIDGAELTRQLVGHALQGLLNAPAVFGLALLFGSLAAGLAATFVLLQILPGVMSVSGLADYGLPRASEAIYQQVADLPTELAVGQALLVVLVWSIVLVGVGALRVQRADVD